MRLKFFNAIFLFVLFICTCIFARAAGITIKIKIKDHDLFQKELKITYYKKFPGVGNWPPDKIITTTIDGDSLFFKIDNPSQFSYIIFYTPSPYDRGVFGVPILVNSKAHIELNLENKQTVFVGESGPNFNTQVKIYNMDIDPTFDNSRDIIGDSIYFTHWFKEYKKVEVKSCKILNDNKSYFTNRSWQILALNNRYQYLLKTFAVLRLYLNSGDNDLEEKVRSFVIKYLKDIPTETKDLYEDSYVYGDYLIEREKLRLLCDKTYSRDPTYNDFGLLFSTFSNQYNGNFRDNLLLKVYTSSNFGNDNRRLFLDTIKSIVREPYVKNIFNNFVSKFLKGATAFNFKLLDTAGKFVRLSDFKGKVVVLDYYYTGCTGCAALTAAMKPVVEEFKDNPNLVFISINLDKTMEKFKKAVQSARYTHSSNVNLYTNGEAWNHKVIAYYNITGAPCLMIIDAKGNMFDGNPPRPNYYKKEETMKFISQVNRALKE